MLRNVEGRIAAAERRLRSMLEQHDSVRVQDTRCYSSKPNTVGGALYWHAVQRLLSQGDAVLRQRIVVDVRKGPGERDRRKIVMLIGPKQQEII
jgi:hypothetical protein